MAAAHEHPHVDHGEPGLGHARQEHAAERRHSHDHAAGIDPALATSASGIRAVKLSLAALGATAAAQLVIVLISGSVALLADTVHNEYRRVGGRFPRWNATHSGIAVSASVDPQPIDRLDWVIAAAIVGAAGNEAVALYRIRVGRRIGSAALVADGHHARTDGLTSLGVLFGAIGMALGFERADPIVGLAISVAIVFLLREAAKSVARWTGHDLNAELEIQVDPTIEVRQGHAIAEEVEHRVLHALPRLRGATVHVDPHDHGTPDGPMAHHRTAGEAPASP